MVRFLVRRLRRPGRFFEQRRPRHHVGQRAGQFRLHFDDRRAGLELLQALPAAPGLRYPRGPVLACEVGPRREAPTAQSIRAARRSAARRSVTRRSPAVGRPRPRSLRRTASVKTTSAALWRAPSPAARRPIWPPAACVLIAASPALLALKQEGGAPAADCRVRERRGSTTFTHYPPTADSVRSGTFRRLVARASRDDLQRADAGPSLAAALATLLARFLPAFGRRFGGTGGEQPQRTLGHAHQRLLPIALPLQPPVLALQDGQLPRRRPRAVHAARVRRRGAVRRAPAAPTDNTAAGSCPAPAPLRWAAALPPALPKWRPPAAAPGTFHRQEPVPRRRARGRGAFSLLLC